MFRILALIAAAVTVAIVSSSCQTKKYLPTDFKDRQILFGSGGGFTGVETTYILMENGQLFQANLDETFVELHVLDKSTTKDFFDRLTDCNMAEMDFNKPGNMYFFLEEKGKKVNKRLVWGDQRSGRPSDMVHKLHGELIRTVRDLHESKIDDQNQKRKEAESEAPEKEAETQMTDEATSQPSTKPTSQPTSQPNKEDN